MWVGKLWEETTTTSTIDLPRGNHGVQGIIGDNTRGVGGGGQVLPYDGECGGREYTGGLPNSQNGKPQVSKN